MSEDSTPRFRNPEELQSAVYKARMADPTTRAAHVDFLLQTAAVQDHHSNAREAAKQLILFAQGSQGEEKERILAVALNRNAIVGHLDQAAAMDNISRISQLVTPGDANDRLAAEQYRQLHKREAEIITMKPIGVVSQCLQTAKEVPAETAIFRVASEMATEHYAQLEPHVQQAIASHMQALQAKSSTASIQVAPISGQPQAFVDEPSGHLTRQLERSAARPAGLGK